MNQINPTKKIVIVFEGKEYHCNRPKIGSVIDMEKAVQDASETGQGGTQLILDFIAKCGLPQEVVRELDDEQLEQVMTILTPAKKKPLAP